MWMINRQSNSDVSIIESDDWIMSMCWYENLYEMVCNKKWKMGEKYEYSWSSIYFTKNIIQNRD